MPQLRGVDPLLDDVRDVLLDRKTQLHLLAQALLEYETLSGEEIAQLLADGKLDRPDRPSGPVRPAAVLATGSPRFSLAAAASSTP